jgi:hypothetical protein
VKQVKAYLLGILDDHEADALEERYFCDPAFLGWVREMEADLIRDYLEDRLPASQRANFERRYFEIPELKKRFDEVSSQASPARPASARIRWQIVPATVVLLLAGVSLWTVWRNHTARPAAIVATQAPAGQPVLLAVNLTRGVTKGPGAAQVSLTPPPGGQVFEPLSAVTNSTTDANVYFGVPTHDARAAVVDLHRSPAVFHPGEIVRATVRLGRAGAVFILRSQPGGPARIVYPAEAQAPAKQPAGELTLAFDPVVPTTDVCSPQTVRLRVLILPSGAGSDSLAEVVQAVKLAHVRAATEAIRKAGGAARGRSQNIHPVWPESRAPHLSLCFARDAAAPCQRGAGKPRRFVLAAVAGCLAVLSQQSGEIPALKASIMCG